MAFNSKPLISFVYLLVLITSIASSSLITIDEECLALFQFKQSILHQDYIPTSFNRFQKIDSWRTPTISNLSQNIASFDCCLWDGVVCSKNEGHVVELDLSESSIHGHITSNSTLFNLVHLQKLNISKNYFVESQIPSEIACLKQLRSLDLSDSGFSGKVPNEISHLTQLSLLDLSFNSLNLETLSLLQNLTRLEELNLKHVNINSSVPHFFANFSSLTSINFENCQLRGKLPTAIFHLSKLKYLSLGLNPDLTGSLPYYHNNTLLEHLNLYITGFFGIIPESISNLNHLKYLNLGVSFFSGSVPSSLSNLTRLTLLSLRTNNFTGKIPSLASLSKLKNLDLSENIFEKGCDYGWVSKLTNLIGLYLNRNNLYYEILPSLANLSKLSDVSVAGNFIPGFIPTSFWNLTQLTYVNLEENQLHGIISPAFANFKRLKALNLVGNQFFGRVDLNVFLGLNRLEDLSLEGISVVTTETYTNGTIPTLKGLGLPSCDLKDFPFFLRFQKNMIALDLSNNKIGGLLPAWIFNNSQETMSVIGLKNNKLIGEIPSSICKAKSLRFLHFGSNNLTGTLPACLGNFKSLVSLNVKQNRFHGTIPNSFTRESRLEMIDLSENQFTGPLPKSLANCTNLEVLNVGDNVFDGVFPFWLGNFKELQVLILRSNKFFGTIQDPFTFRSEFPKLRIFDLSNNGFSGQLPDKYFGIWNAMKYIDAGYSTSMGDEFLFGSILIDCHFSMSIITKGVKTEYPKILTIFTLIDLSCNSFEGMIPHSLTDLQGLESLNLSNNHLTGYVLPSLGNLKNLESLDLSNNKLSGEIPQQLLQLGFLTLFNVSFNHLEGHVPTGGQFNTFENYSYVGNPLLCGQPLSNECQGSTTSKLTQTSNEYESFLPDDIIDWVVIFIGFGSGSVIGVVLGNFVCERYRDWFIE